MNTLLKAQLLTAVLLCLWSTSLAILKDLPEVLRTPEKRFNKLSAVGFKWPPRYLEISLPSLPKLRMHYIDEGSANATETLLLLHGTPAWSFLWRDVIPSLLLKGYRVVAPDFIGCGRSDKLTATRLYSHDMHVQSLQVFVKQLGLKDITLIGHDLGGPIGGSVIMRDSANYKRVGLFNTWLPQGDVFATVPRFLAHVPYLTFRMTTLAMGLYHPVGVIFTLGTKATPAEVLHGYKAPFPDHTYKAGVSSWPPMIPLYPGELMALEMKQVADFFRNSWGSRPALVSYSSGELFTRPGQALLQEVLPRACMPVVGKAGHFLMEDQPMSVAGVIIGLVEGTCFS